MRIFSGAILTAALVLTSCPQPVAPSPDASDAAPIPVTIDSAPVPVGPVSQDCALACTALKTAGCALGDAGDCGTFMMRDIGSGKVPNAATGAPLTCLSIQAVHTKTDAQKLGFVCP
ncbi:MAG: hypothetical protein ACLP1X_00145 [Polyangiaceae bacterium]|jgi:hypothetical protein